MAKLLVGNYDSREKKIIENMFYKYGRSVIRQKVNGKTTSFMVFQDKPYKYLGECNTLEELEKQFVPKYKSPVIKPKLTEKQQSILNIVRLIDNDSKISLSNAEKRYLNIMLSGNSQKPGEYAKRACERSFYMNYGTKRNHTFRERIFIFKDKDGNPKAPYMGHILGYLTDVKYVKEKVTCIEKESEYPMQKELEYLKMYYIEIEGYYLDTDKVPYKPKSDTNATKRELKSIHSTPDNIIDDKPRKLELVSIEEKIKLSEKYKAQKLAELNWEYLHNGLNPEIFTQCHNC